MERAEREREREKEKERMKGKKRFSSERNGRIEFSICMQRELN